MDDGIVLIVFENDQPHHAGFNIEIDAGGREALKYTV
jgi:hypothetical protein